MLRNTNNKPRAVRCKVVIDSRANQKGLSKLYYRLSHGNIKRDIPIGVVWPKEKFDKIAQILKPRYPGDQDVEAKNLLIAEFKHVAHRLQLRGFLKRTTISLDDLMHEFRSVNSSSDFFAFMEEDIERLYKTQIISNPTWRRHRCSLHTLQKFWDRPSLSFLDIDLDFIERFDAWAFKVHKKKSNTVSGYHKDFKKYLNRAVKKELIDVNPYSEFSFKYVDGERSVLSRDEVKMLYKLWKENRIIPEEQEVLRRFLFSCVTGLRISDTSQVTRNMISGKTLIFTPYKGRLKGKLLKVPLSAIAFTLIEGREKELFMDYSHSYINATLKLIAARADISKRLTYHVARDTFGTTFVEMGGDVKSLQSLMGHSNIKTTMIYLKMSDHHKEKLMANFDSIMMD